MNPEELQVAEAAIAAPHNTTYDAIHDLISQTTGIPKHQVEAVVKHLLREGFLHVHAGPTTNLAAGEPVVPPAKGWYEKGSMWK
jgi:hypothetical protein